MIQDDSFKVVGPEVHKTSLVDLQPQDTISVDSGAGLPSIDRNNKQTTFLSDLEIKGEAPEFLVNELIETLEQILPARIRVFLENPRALGIDEEGQITLSFTLRDPVKESWLLPSPALFDAENCEAPLSDPNEVNPIKKVLTVATIVANDNLSQDEMCEPVDSPVTIVARQLRSDTQLFEIHYFFSSKNVPECVMERLIDTAPTESSPAPEKGPSPPPEEQDLLQTLRRKRKPSAAPLAEVMQEQWQDGGKKDDSHVFSHARDVLDQVLRTHYQEKWGIELKKDESPAILSISREDAALPIIQVALEIPSLDLVEDDGGQIEVIGYKVLLDRGQLTFKELPGSKAVPRSEYR